MTVRELVEVMDGWRPVWINNGNDCEFFANQADLLDTATEKQLTANVEYLTIDGQNNFTIEI